MVKLISEEILPKNKRASASKEEVLSCLEKLEEKVREMVEDPLYDTFDAINQQIRKINESIRTETLTIKSEDKDFDRLLKYMVDIEKTGKGLKYLLDNGTKPIRPAETKKKDLTQYGVNDQ